MCLNSDREKLLCNINLPNIGIVSDRLMSGVALFLTTYNWFISISVLNQNLTILLSLYIV